MIQSIIRAWGQDVVLATCSKPRQRLWMGARWAGNQSRPFITLLLPHNFLHNIEKNA